jgi:hypothetical protein
MKEKGITPLTPVFPCLHHLASLWISFSGAAVFASLEADARGQYQPSCRVPLEFSLDEPRIGQPFPGHGLIESVNALQGVPFHVSVIEAEGELVNVAMQMLGLAW